MNCSKENPVETPESFPEEEMKFDGKWNLALVIDDSALSRSVPDLASDYFWYEFSSAHNRFEQLTSFGPGTAFQGGDWRVTQIGFVFIERRAHWDFYDKYFGDSINITADYGNSRYRFHGDTLKLTPTDHDYPELYFENFNDAIDVYLFDYITDSQSLGRIFIDLEHNIVDSTVPPGANLDSVLNVYDIGIDIDPYSFTIFGDTNIVHIPNGSFSDIRVFPTDSTLRDRYGEFGGSQLFCLKTNSGYYAKFGVETAGMRYYIWCIYAVQKDGSVNIKTLPH
jgi:hypothetical protein